MELLVVLLIIGILSTVALRTIDATRDRALFDQTTKEMTQLIQAMVGNPDLTYDGRRVDFGYYGDMERLPDSLQDLVVNPGDTNWHGPYLRIMATADDSSYRFDGWGHPYQYMADHALIHSMGSARFDMTMKIVDDTSQLHDNTISGTVTDVNDRPPYGAAVANNLYVILRYNNETDNAPETLRVDSTGFYQFAPPNVRVPIGIHKVQAAFGTDTLTRWVTVVPRSRTVVDFKFGRSFFDKLRMVGSPTVTTGGKGFLIHVVNGDPEDVTVSHLQFTPTSAPYYLRGDFYIGSDHDGFPLGSGVPGVGPGDTVQFTAVTIAPNMTQQIDVCFREFYADSMGVTPDTAINVSDNTFQFRFSDGSEITVKP